MTPNPFVDLLHSKKFWLAVLDAVTSAALFFVGKYYGAALDDLKFIILILQPIAIVLIGSIAAKDVVVAHAEGKLAVAVEETKAAEAFSPRLPPAG